MTNATTPEATPQDIEALQAAITEAESKVSTLKAAMANDAPNIMAEATKSGDYSTLTARGEEIKNAELGVTKAKAKLDEASRASRWENLSEAREPITNVLRELLITSKPVAQITSVKGVAKVADDGTVEVSLTPSYEKVDMGEIEKAVAAAFDGPAFKATNVTSIEINVLGIDRADATVNMLPTANTSIQFRNKAAVTGDAPRSGAKSWSYNGQTGLSSKDFLVAAFANGETYLTDKRRKSYDTAMGPSGNGLSNLAVDLGKHLNITPTEA